MTEFVLCLPIFVTIFAGLLNLAALGQKSVLNKARATRKMWSTSYRAEERAARMSPRAQLGGAARALSRGRLGGAISAGSGGIGGHWGESYVDTMQIGRVYGASPSSSGSPRGRRLRRRASPRPGARGLLGEADLGRALLDDALTPNDVTALRRAASGGGWGAVEFVADAVVQITGSVPGTLAGIRYGDVEGTSRGSLELLTGERIQLRADYSTAISPSPVRRSELKQWGSAWVLGQTGCHYRNMLNMMAPSLKDCAANARQVRVGRY